MTSSRLRREATVHAAQQHLMPAPTRMSSEISSAIRRRQETSGVDYWKSGFNSLGPVTAYNVQDKRPSYDRLTHVNLDFPGAFLPNVGAPSRPSKTKRKESTSPTLLLTRNKTSMPTIHSHGNRSGDNLSAKKAVVTDLTCLQLADTLFSNSNSSFSGFLNFTPEKVRYMDYFDDGHAPGEYIKWKGRNNYKASSPYQTIQADDCRHSNSSIRCSPDTDERELVIQVDTPRGEKPQKSILKNSEKPCADNLSFNRSVSSYTLPLSSRANQIQRQDSTVSLHDDHVIAVQTSCPKPASPSAIGPLHGYAVTKLYTDGPLDSSRKRSVRFNTSNQIREYKPTEPVCS